MKELLLLFTISVSCIYTMRAQTKDTTKIIALEDIQKRECVNRFYLDSLGKIDTTFFESIYPYRPNKSRHVKAVISFPNRIICNDAIVEAKTLDSLFFEDIFIPAHYTLYGRGHFEGKRFFVKLRSVNINGKDYFVNFDVFDTFDLSIGIPGLNSYSYKPKLYGTTKTEIKMGDAKFELEIKMDKNNDSIILIDAKERIPVFLIANYKDKNPE